MAKIPDLIEEEEAEVELSLGLSIGRSFRKNPTSQISVLPLDRSLTVDRIESNGGGGYDLVDPHRKREIHVLRRQEARKKREERLLQQPKKESSGNAISVNSQDRMVLEDQELQCRARDRMVKENEPCRSELARKCKKKIGENTSPNPNFVNQNSAFSVMPPMHYPFHPMQCMPIPNGFNYHYFMPCWAPTTTVSPVSAAAGDCVKSAWQGFRPFHPLNYDRNGSSDLEQSGGGVLSGSPRSSSPAISDNLSGGSMQGGGSNSSDTRSHSSCSPFVQTGVSQVCNAQEQIEHSNSTHQKESAQIVEEATDKLETNTALYCPTKPQPIAAATDEPASYDSAESGLTKPKKPIATPPKMGGDDALGKENRRSPSPSLPNMPRVSTTGNGPNGKTITGFLYRYTKSEVSIVCVCHGSSFSPAEFVKHAGGTDISHPLRHILVVPSALG